MNDKREKCEFDRSRPLFERKRIPCEVHIRCVEPNGMAGSNSTHLTNNAGRVQILKKCVNFTLRVMQGTRASNLGSSTNEKALRFELSDEYSKSLENLSIETQLGSIQLYELEVGESDFSDLRNDQALLVDFSNFASSFISLLQMCELGQECDESKDVAYQQMSPFSGCKLFTGNYAAERFKTIPESERLSTSKYTCRLETASNTGTLPSTWNASSSSSSCATKTARFSIVETNQFRELTHFSLNLRFASDVAVRYYLSMRLCDVMNCESILSRQLEKEKEKLKKLETEFDANRDQLGNIMELSRVHTDTLQKEVEEKLRKETDRHRLEMDTTQKKYEKVIYDLKESFLEEKQKLEEKLLGLERSSVERIRAMTDEGKVIEQSLLQSQTLASSLEQIKSNQDSVIATLENRLSQIMEESSNQRSLIDTHKAELKGLSVQVEYLKKDKDKLQQIIKRYHEDRKEMKRRMKARVDMLRVHEEALVSKDIEITSMHARMEEIESTIEGLRIELSSKEKQVDEMKVSLIDQKKTLESNQQVISWLNKEINNIHKGGSGLSSVYDSMDDTLKNLPSDFESCEFNRVRCNRTTPELSVGSLYNFHSSTCMNTLLKTTPTKTTRWMSVDEGPNFTRPLHNPAFLPEPQPYESRDKVISQNLTL